MLLILKMSFSAVAKITRADIYKKLNLTRRSNKVYVFVFGNGRRHPFYGRGVLSITQGSFKFLDVEIA